MNIKERVSLAAIHMKQSNLGLAAKSLFGSIDVSSSTYRPDDYFYPILGNAEMRHFEGMSSKAYTEAYLKCPPLSSIINRKAQAFTNGESYIINTSGKAKDRDATGDVAIKIKKLMASPNPLQTGDEFRIQNYIYTQLYGYCPVLAIKPVGFPWHEATAMWNIPPPMCTITEKQGLFYKQNGNIESIQFCYGGVSINLPLDNVAIIKDIMPSLNTVIIPESRVATLTMQINNIIGAYESRNMLINSRGALGMLTNQTADSASHIKLKPDEKDELHADFKKLYGLRRGQSHVIITSANLKWQSMVLPTRELMLFEEVEDDGNRICDTYMFPSQLFAKMSTGGTTFSNMSTATRNLYQDAIMPEAKNIYSQWNKIFDTAGNGLEIGMEYKNLPALQSANKEEAEAKLRLNQSLQIEFRNDQITRNEWRIAMGRYPLPEAEGDLYYSDIKERLGPAEKIEDTQVEDNTKPRDGNTGEPGQQA